MNHYAILICKDLKGMHFKICNYFLKMMKDIYSMIDVKEFDIDKR